MKRRHTLLIVDDEVDVLESLRHQFHRAYRVLTAATGKAAIDLLHENEVHLILSDQRMPGMSGDVFLSQARRLQPDAIRMLFTGYADIQAVINAVNEGHIFRYILKPWDTNELEGIIREAAQKYDLLTERKELIAELQEANVRLTRANDDLARAAELLHAQVQRFETLLTDLLEISRYDAGSVQLEYEPTSLAHLAEDVIASMQQLADQHGTDVRLVAPGGYSPVDMDPRRVRRIVRNLLGNAIEHGEGRPIVVTVDSNQRAVAIGVRDYGLGMNAADAERVFDRFWRADPSRKRTIGGTGLGLSIALGDAKLHGGTLAVWSDLGRGTNFVLTLPRQGQPIDGSSPVPVDPGEDGVSLDDLGLTQPITVFDKGGRS